MKQKGNTNNKSKLSKKTASLGVTLKVAKKPSGKLYFPEKLKEANNILSNMKFIHVK